MRDCGRGRGREGGNGVRMGHGGRRAPSGRGGGGTGRPRAARTRAHLELGHHHDARHHRAAGGISALAAPAHLVSRSRAGQTLPRRMPFLFRRRPRPVTARRERGRRRRVRASTIPLVHATVDARPRRHRHPDVTATAPPAGGKGEKNNETPLRSRSVSADPMDDCHQKYGIITSRANFLTGLHTPRNAFSRYTA